jgi:hypothetical protein
MPQTKRKIKAKEIIQDMRAGQTDLEIMAKHELSPKELEHVLEELVRIDAISRSEVDRRASGDARPDYEVETRHAHFVTCTSCGKEYPQDLGECPECGVDLAAVPRGKRRRKPKRHTAQDPKESGVGKIVLIVGAILVVVIAALVATYFLVMRKQEAKLARQSTRSHFLSLQEMAEAYATQNELGGLVALSPEEEVTEALTEPDLDVDAPDVDGRTLLMIAVEYGRYEIVKLLLYYGANIYAMDRQGNTPGILAAKNGYADILDLFVGKGYDVDYKNRKGESARTIAHGSGNSQLKKVILKGTKLPKTDRIALYKMEKSRRLTSLHETCVKMCKSNLSRRSCVDKCMKYYGLGPDNTYVNY